jgi:hypothetical protein
MLSSLFWPAAITAWSCWRRGLVVRRHLNRDLRFEDMAHLVMQMDLKLFGAGCRWVLDGTKKGSRREPHRELLFEISLQTLYIICQYGCQ